MGIRFSSISIDRKNIRTSDIQNFRKHDSEIKPFSSLVIGLLFGLAALNITSCGSSKGATPSRLNVPADYQDIALAIASLQNGGAVYVEAKDTCYEIAEPIHIYQSRTSLIGQGQPCLKLEDGANVPVILVGSASESVSAEEHIFDVRIKGFTIDGNRENQRPADEYDEAPSMPNIKVNGIAVRGAERVFLTDLDIHNTRSGGIVISQNSRKVTIQDVNLNRNFYDGLAISGSHEILAENFIAEGNDYSGVSIDTGSSLLEIRNGTISRNGDNGVFARYTRNSTFSNLTIEDNCNYGVYLSHAQEDGEEGVQDLAFEALKIYRNKNSGFFLHSSAELGSKRIRISSSVFGGNKNPAIVEHDEISEENNTFQEGDSQMPNRVCK